jgi:hypothetical protein
MLKRRSALLAVLLLVIPVAFAVTPACGANGVGYAWVRVAHASPDAPAVDVWVNGAVVLSNVAFGQLSNYLLVPAGDYNIKVTPTGLTAPVVIDADVTLDKDKAYTVAASGLLASIAPVVYMDNNTRPAPGHAKVNFTHLSPDAPAVDVGVVGGGNLFTNVAFKGTSPYIEVPAGQYDLEVKLTGTPTVVLTLNNVDLDMGMIYTVFAEGLAGGGPPPLQAVIALFQPEGTIWYLAEGCTEADFETFILVQNPNDEPVMVGLTFMTNSGPVAGPNATLPPMTRQTWKANEYIADWNVSTMINASLPVVAERSMYGNNRTWGHGSIGVTDPGLTWYLAEGSTEGTFETFILVQNPGTEVANVELIFMTDTGQITGPSMALQPHTRYTWLANSYLTTWNVSTWVSSDQPVVAERAMYGDNRTWAHDSIGYSP